MSEVIKKRVSESVSKEAKIFLYSGFKYEGKITNVDDKFIEILDYKTNSYKIIKIELVADVEVKDE